MPTITEKQSQGVHIASRLADLMNDPLPEGQNGKDLVFRIREMLRVLEVRWSGHAVSSRPFTLLDTTNIGQELQTFAAQEGLDFHATLNAGAQHFQRDVISRDATPLSGAQLESILDDDERAFGRGVS